MNIYGQSFYGSFSPRRMHYDVPADFERCIFHNGRGRDSKGNTATMVNLMRLTVAEGLSWGAGKRLAGTYAATDLRGNRYRQ